MIALTFPDGSVREYNPGITGAELAASISKSLAKKAVAVSLDGALADLSQPITADARVKIVTRDDPEALELIRHDAAHVMAEAVQELFPGTQVTIGPVIENGFYYDFYRDESFTPEDLAKIEEKMRAIVAAGQALHQGGLAASQGARLLRGPGRGLQGRTGRRDPRRPGCEHL